MGYLNDFEILALENIAQTCQLVDGTSLEYNEIYFFNEHAQGNTIDDLKKYLHIFMTNGYDDEIEEDYQNVEIIITEIKDFYNQNY